jgi:hypothetical protein
MRTDMIKNDIIEIDIMIPDMIGNDLIEKDIMKND